MFCMLPLKQQREHVQTRSTKATPVPCIHNSYRINRAPVRSVLALSHYHNPGNDNEPLGCLRHQTVLMCKKGHRTLSPFNEYWWGPLNVKGLVYSYLICVQLQHAFSADVTFKNVFIYFKKGQCTLINIDKCKFTQVSPKANFQQQSLHAMMCP